MASAACRVQLSVNRRQKRSRRFVSGLILTYVITIKFEILVRASGFAGATRRAGRSIIIVIGLRLCCYRYLLSMPAPPVALADRSERRIRLPADFEKK